MSNSGPLAFSKELSQLPSEQSERHEEIVDFFGRFVVWLRGCSLSASQELIESEETREKLGTIPCGQNTRPTCNGLGLLELRRVGSTDFGRDRRPQCSPRLEERIVSATQHSYRYWSGQGPVDVWAQPWDCEASQTFFTVMDCP